MNRLDQECWRAASRLDSKIYDSILKVHTIRRGFGTPKFNAAKHFVVAVLITFQCFEFSVCLIAALIVSTALAPLFFVIL